MTAENLNEMKRKPSFSIDDILSPNFGASTNQSDKSLDFKNSTSITKTFQSLSGENGKEK